MSIAFLYGEVEEDIYVVQPLGIEDKSNECASFKRLYID